MAGIYIHIPFCKQACYYCDFHFSTNQQDKGKMIAALTDELIFRKDFLQGEPVSTIYFGGGTPSLLSASEIEVLLTVIQKVYDVGPKTEITLEANPDDLTVPGLADLTTLGVNRLSIGIQSFENQLLTFLHRAHDSATAKHSVELAREAGFGNISIDLIYAIPGLDDSLWIAQLDQAISLGPEHISCYALTIEDRTAFGRWTASGKLKPVDEETAARQLEITSETLVSAGYQHYEISNFARTGFISKHNTAYWQQQKYLGIGPGAHSYNGSIRMFNVRNNAIYIRQIQSGQLPAETETLTLQNKINEYILTTLRTTWGSDLSQLKRDFDVDLLHSNNGYISQLIAGGLANLENNVLTLSSKGRLLADKIASDLFVVDT